MWWVSTKWHQFQIYWHLFSLLFLLWYGALAPFFFCFFSCFVVADAVFIMHKEADYSCHSWSLGDMDEAFLFQACGSGTILQRWDQEFEHGCFYKNSFASEVHMQHWRSGSRRWYFVFGVFVIYLIIFFQLNGVISAVSSFCFDMQTDNSVSHWKNEKGNNHQPRAFGEARGFVMEEGQKNTVKVNVQLVKALSLVFLITIRDLNLVNYLIKFKFFFKHVIEYWRAFHSHLLVGSGWRSHLRIWKEKVPLPPFSRIRLTYSSSDMEGERSTLTL